MKIKYKKNDEIFEESYKIKEIFEFDSKRQRMSVIFEDREK